MPRYAITFDLDNTAMEADQLSKSFINNKLYGTEVKAAMTTCGSKIIQRVPCITRTTCLRRIA